MLVLSLQSMSLAVLCMNTKTLKWMRSWVELTLSKTLNCPLLFLPDRPNMIVANLDISEPLFGGEQKI